MEPGNILSNYEDNIWRPFPKQIEYLQIPDTVKEALYGGALGGGKSELLLLLPIARGWVQNPKFKGIIFRRSYRELQDSLIPRSHEPPFGYKYLGGKYNDNKHQWTWESGAWIRFGFIESDNDARSHDTAQYNYIAFDQLEHFTLWQYIYMFTRNRSVDKNLPAIVRSAANPGGIGTTWVRDRFVSPYPTGGKLLVDPLSKTSRIFIPARLEDNPYLEKNNPDYKRSLLLLPEAERKAKLEGDWFAMSGQSFPEFREKRYLDEPENACHVIEPFLIPDFWPKLVCIDIGFNANNAVLWGAVSPEDRLYIYRGMARKKTKISEWASEFAFISQYDKNIVAVYMDPKTGWNSLGEEELINQQFTKHSGYPAQKADNDRIGGKLLVHDMLRWTQKPKRFKAKEGFDLEEFNRLFRNYGVSKANDYKLQFIEDETFEVLPKLQIFNTVDLKPLREVFGMCRNDEHRLEDVEAWEGDDFYDCVRFMCKAYGKYLLEGVREHKKFVAVSEIEKKFATDGDYFSYHMKMTKLEHTQRKAGFGVKLYN